MAALKDAQLKAWMRAGAKIAGRSDGDGLTFTLSAAKPPRQGTATWVFRYRFGGKPREVKLGNYPDLSLVAARAAARAARVQVDQGRDVAAVRRADILRAGRAGTFRQLADDYMEKAAPVLAATSRAEAKRYLDKDILQRIGHLPIGDVSGLEVVRLVEQIGKRSDPVARRAFALLSVIFAHGMAKHLVAHNPCGGLRLEAILGPAKPRRARINLTAAQLRALMDHLPSIGVANALSVKILLATCVRKGELIRARWTEVDFRRGEWTIPAENSKSKRGFVIPLAPAVVGWFMQLKGLAGASPWVRPGVKGRHLSRTALNQALSRLPVALPKFSPHDLRSTARSHLAELGVSIPVAERCLNHSLGGLIGVYDQHDYLDERRKALELWANAIAKIEEAPATALRIVA